MRKKQNKDKNDLSNIKDWHSDLQKQNNDDNHTPNSSPKSTPTTETLTPQPFTSFKDRFGNQINLPCGVPSEEGQNEETFEDPLEEIS